VAPGDNGHLKLIPASTLRDDRCSPGLVQAHSTPRPQAGPPRERPGIAATARRTTGRALQTSAGTGKPESPSHYRPLEARKRRWPCSNLRGIPPSGLENKVTVLGFASGCDRRANPEIRVLLEALMVSGFEAATGVTLRCHRWCPPARGPAWSRRKPSPKSMGTVSEKYRTASLDVTKKQRDLQKYLDESCFRL
jgi:hypothetical protein